MANEAEQPKAEEAAKEQPKPEAQGQEAQKPAADDSSEVKDSHGQPGINKERHDREVKALNDKIAELQAQIDEKAKTEKARDELKAEIEKLHAEIADERTAWELEKAGCRNVKAAKALLEDHEGDVRKLKEACPYLFEEERKGSTGFKPEGASRGGDEAKIDRILGIKTKKE